MRIQIFATIFILAGLTLANPATPTTSLVETPSTGTPNIPQPEERNAQPNATPEENYDEDHRYTEEESRANAETSYTYPKGRVPKVILNQQRRMILSAIFPNFDQPKDTAWNYTLDPNEEIVMPVKTVLYPIVRVVGKDIGPDITPETPNKGTTTAT